MKKYMTHPLVMLFILLISLNAGVILSLEDQGEDPNAEPDPTTLPQIIRDRSDEPSLYVPGIGDSTKETEY